MAEVVGMEEVASPRLPLSLLVCGVERIVCITTINRPTISTNQGGLAGMAYHTATYPFDVAKTRIQIQTGPEPIYRGTLHCFRTLYQQGTPTRREKEEDTWAETAHARWQPAHVTGGAGALFKGYVPTVLRSFPANAVGFLVSVNPCPFFDWSWVEGLDSGLRAHPPVAALNNDQGKIKIWLISSLNGWKKQNTESSLLVPHFISVIFCGASSVLELVNFPFPGKPVFTHANEHFCNYVGVFFPCPFANPQLLPGAV